MPGMMIVMIPHICQQLGRCLFWCTYHELLSGTVMQLQADMAYQDIAMKPIAVGYIMLISDVSQVQAGNMLAVNFKAGLLQCMTF